ncbi:MAG: Verru_Chthon cassette protein C, partial [Verrucomicrobiales bacterium]|nr:Verru_Chthon cassette protein C [Verrucomicrobiales bacterium]
LLLLTALLDQIQKTWRSSEDRVGQFREARVAFDIITKNVSQASLNTYWDYHYDPSTNTPDYYERRSELHFRTFKADEIQGQIPGATTTTHALFFQAPLGFSVKYRNLNNLFNGRGYFVAFTDDTQFRPKFIDAEPKYRFRLMEFRPPAEENQVFSDGLEEREQGRTVVFDNWWKHTGSTVGSSPFFDHVHPLAENIIALIISPRDTLEESGGDRRNTYSEIAPNYEYDSNEHSNPKYIQQIPPLVRVTMVAIDETAGVRLEQQYGGDIPPIVNTSLFSNTTRYDDDIAELSEDLAEQGIGYKVFSTIVMLRSSRWSTYEIEGAGGTP